MASIAPPENRQTVYDINKSADYGYITYEEYVQLISEAVGITPEEAKEIFHQKHIRNEPLIGFVRSLRAQYKTGLLSNVGVQAMSLIFTPEELEELFDAVTLSGEVGVVKPSPEIYEITAQRLGLLSDECVMIDDIPRNVEGAERVGMRGILYSSNAQLKAEIAKLTGEEQPHA